MPDHPDTPSRARLDPLAAGRYALGGGAAPPRPEVEGYAVLRFIARGGLGEVWQGIRITDSRRVALKVPLAEDAEFQERILREAGTLRALRHPNITALIDVTSTRDGRPVLVMELVEGATLAVRLPDSGFAFEHALQIFLPVLDAVAFAHSLDIVHRDLKPANILIGGDGVPKVADFGLARSVKDRIVSFSLTHSGAVAGTVEYLAPECYRADSPGGPKGDIYALGVLLYELLTGTPPRGAWRPLSEVKALDVRLDELLADAIQPDPAKRLGSVEEFRRRLVAVRDSPPRLAGTPLATPAVRLLDFGWTCAGLYLCVAGFCATLSQTRTPVPAFFDLTFFMKGLLIAGFLATWFLSQCIGLMALWQIVRLIRFRHVPLAESLPAPFGLRLGRSRLPGLLAGLAQVVCVLLPVTFTLVVAAQCMDWWTPQTPEWQERLVVTEWANDTPVSPWKWDPGAMLDGGRYWLKEGRDDVLGTGLAVTDKTSFFLFLQPFLMVVAAGVTGLALLITGVRLVREWGRAHRLRLAAGSVVFAATSGILGLILWHDFLVYRVQGADPVYSQARQLEYVGAQMAPRLEAMMPALFLHTTGPADKSSLAALFRSRVTWPDGAKLSPGGIAAWSRNERATFARKGIATCLPLVWSVAYPEIRADYALKARWYEFRPVDGKIEASVRTMILRGSATPGVDHRIHTVTEETVQLYSAEPGPLEPADLRAFLEAFAAAWSDPAHPGLDALIFPFTLSPSGGFREGAATPGRIRESRARWQTFQLSLPPELPVPVFADGARWRVTTAFPWQGTRRGAASATVGALPCCMDLARIDGAWRIVWLELR